MAIFNYVAVNINGKTVKGVISGDSASQIKQMLHDRKLTPIEIFQPLDQTESQGSVPKRSFSFLRRKKISVSQLAVTTYQFATLLGAGLPVETALQNMISELDNPTLKRTILGVRTKVIEGHTLASGMADYPNIFPKLYVASVAVGEKTGQLDKVLMRLAEYYESQRQMREKVFHALIYPILLSLVAIGVVVFLLIYVIPQVTNIFIETGQALPTVTLILLAISETLKKYGLYFLILIVSGLAILKYTLSRNKKFRYQFHKMLLKTPVIKSTLIAINAARFSRTFGILFAAGVPVLEAMTSANSIIELLPMHEALADAIRKVGEGASIHKSLQQTGYFSSLSNQLIASGETSGKLEAMLEKAATFQEQNTTQKINTALALFEPILILTMGCMVLFIVLAVLLPIFEMNEMVR